VPDYTTLCRRHKTLAAQIPYRRADGPLNLLVDSTMTVDYQHDCTTWLLAALDVKSSLVIRECRPRHQPPGSGLHANHERGGAKEFLRFLRRINWAVKKRRDVHLVLDYYAPHKTPEVQAWLEKHRRFKLHFTSISASWLNMVERFFAEITSKRIRRGSYTSVDDLETAISDYLVQHNAKPKPFTRTKTAEDILARERRALDKLDEIIGNRSQASDSEH
jgi:transposase